MTAHELREMCRGARSALVAGLGNRDITSDALGPAVVSQLIVTSHIKRYMQNELSESFASVSAVAPGVMGTTGIETLDIIRGITQKLKPEVIIAVDALAGADLSRVCSTIQIADTGIAPGSGIGNRREGLNRETLGIPVIAIGVPTVIAAELLTGAELTEDFAPLMVTTKDIDNVIRRMSRTVANAINLAMHEDMSLHEIENLTN
jgi:spore protease